MIEAALGPSRPETTDTRIPRRDALVTRDLIDRWAKDRPMKVFAKFDDDGEEWTYADLRQRVLQTALGLQSLGVGQADHVLVWTPNSREHLLTFFALNYLGAVYVPINTAYRGRLLEHVLAVSDAKLAVIHAELCPRLADINLALLSQIITVGGPAECPLPTTTFEDALKPTAGCLEPPARPIEPWDPMATVFTSGTTGPSKGVLASYLHLFTNAGPESWPFVTEDDRWFVNFPMFHIGGMATTYVMLCRGASIGYVDRFDTKTYWDAVRRTESTAAFLLGAMATFLEKAEPSPKDANHPLRLAFMVPLSGDIEAFSRRFGIDVYTIFNMTEVSSPIVSEPNPTKRGTCGKARPGVEVRLVDENDCEVPIGHVGEMMVRTDRPWCMNSGYYKNAEATALAWRNGWFHTGDAFIQDKDGYFYFVDRIKDAIRRRGENISSLEVEAEALAHPDILEAAAIAVPSDMGEDEVMLCLAPQPGRTIDPAAFIAFLQPRMAYFMIPRYMRILPDLPKTATAKVLKHALRTEGITPDTWDREAAGIVIKGERFV
jgi:crotonobetaine/carnitine-CoA ligase